MWRASEGLALSNSSILLWWNCYGRGNPPLAAPFLFCATDKEIGVIVPLVSSPGVLYYSASFEDPRSTWSVSDDWDKDLHCQTADS